MEDTQAELTNTPSGRAVVTVLGSDRAGIVAAVAGVVAKHEANILDISQTILQGNEPENPAGGTGIFTMTMLVDLSPMDVDFQALDDELDALASELGVRITLVREDVFRFMYRL